ncbi:MAG: hypothetical protein WC335_04670 [Candidatus Omnitrophota bacterium]|jgi:hypothetical protein
MRQISNKIIFALIVLLMCLLLPSVLRAESFGETAISAVGTGGGSAAEISGDSGWGGSGNALEDFYQSDSYGGDNLAAAAAAGGSGAPAANTPVTKLNADVFMPYATPLDEAVPGLSNIFSEAQQSAQAYTGVDTSGYDWDYEVLAVDPAGITGAEAGGMDLSGFESMRVQLNNNGVSRDVLLVNKNIYSGMDIFNADQSKGADYEAAVLKTAELQLHDAAQMKLERAGTGIEEALRQADRVGQEFLVSSISQKTVKDGLAVMSALGEKNTKLMLSGLDDETAIAYVEAMRSADMKAESASGTDNGPYTRFTAPDGSEYLMDKDGNSRDISRGVEVLSREKVTVEKDDFSRVSTDTEKLWGSLFEAGYIDSEGAIQDAFAGLSDASKMRLEGYSQDDLTKIYTVMEDSYKLGASPSVLIVVGPTDKAGDSLCHYFPIDYSSMSLENEDWYDIKLNQEIFDLKGAVTGSNSFSVPLEKAVDMTVSTVLIAGIRTASSADSDWQKFKEDCENARSNIKVTLTDVNGKAARAYIGDLRGTRSESSNKGYCLLTMPLEKVSNPDSADLKNIAEVSVAFTSDVKIEPEKLARTGGIELVGAGNSEVDRVSSSVMNACLESTDRLLNNNGPAWSVDFGYTKTAGQASPDVYMVSPDTFSLTVEAALEVNPVKLGDYLEGNTKELDIEGLIGEVNREFSASYGDNAGLKNYLSGNQGINVDAVAESIGDKVEAGQEEAPALSTDPAVFINSMWNSGNSAVITRALVVTDKEKGLEILTGLDGGVPSSNGAVRSQVIESLSQPVDGKNIMAEWVAAGTIEKTAGLFDVLDEFTSETLFATVSTERKADILSHMQDSGQVVDMVANLGSAGNNEAGDVIHMMGVEAFAGRVEEALHEDTQVVEGTAQIPYTVTNLFNSGLDYSTGREVLNSMPEDSAKTVLSTMDDTVLAGYLGAGLENKGSLFTLDGSGGGTMLVDGSGRQLGTQERAVIVRDDDNIPLGIVIPGEAEEGADQNSDANFVFIPLDYVSLTLDNAEKHVVEVTAEQGASYDMLANGDKSGFSLDGDLQGKAGDYTVLSVTLNNPEEETDPVNIWLSGNDGHSAYYTLRAQEGEHTYVVPLSDFKGDARNAVKFNVLSESAISEMKLVRTDISAVEKDASAVGSPLAQDTLNAIGQTAGNGIVFPGMQNAGFDAGYSAEQGVFGYSSLSMEYELYASVLMPNAGSPDEILPGAGKLFTDALEEAKEYLPAGAYDLDYEVRLVDPGQMSAEDLAKIDIGKFESLRAQTTDGTDVLLVNAGIFSGKDIAGAEGTQAAVSAVIHGAVEQELMGAGLDWSAADKQARGENTRYLDAVSGKDALRSSASDNNYPQEKQDRFFAQYRDKGAVMENTGGVFSEVAAAWKALSGNDFIWPSDSVTVKSVDYADVKGTEFEDFISLYDASAKILYVRGGGLTREMVMHQYVESDPYTEASQTTEKPSVEYSHEWAGALEKVWVLADIFGMENLSADYNKYPGHGFIWLSKQMDAMGGEQAYRDKVNELSGVVGREAMGKAFANGHYDFQNTLQFLADNGYDTLNTLVNTYGKEAVAEAFTRKDGDFTELLKSAAVLGEDNLEKINAFAGKDKMTALMTGDPRSCACFLQMLAKDNDIEKFKENYEAVVDVFGADTIQASFEKDPCGVGYLAQVCGDMSADAFSGFMNDFEDILGKDNTMALLEQNPAVLSMYIFMADEEWGMDKFLENLKNVVDIIGQEDMGEHIRAEESFFFNSMYSVMEADLPDLTAVADMFGKDTVVNALVSGDYSVMEVYKTVQSMGSDKYDAIVCDLGQDTVNTLSADMEQYNNFLKTVGQIGLEPFKAAVELFGTEKVFAAYNKDYYFSLTIADEAAGVTTPFNDVMKSINTMGVDNFKGFCEIVGKDNAGDALNNNIERFAEALKQVNALGYSDFSRVCGLLGGDKIKEAFTQDRIVDDGDAHIIDSSFSVLVNTVKETGGAAKIEELVSTYGLEKVSGLLLEDIRWERFDSSIRKDMLMNRLENKPDGRQLTVLIAARHDWNGAFTFGGSYISPLIANDRRVLYYEVSNIEEAEQALADATGRTEKDGQVGYAQKADEIIIMGHANPYSLTLGEGGSSIGTHNIDTLQPVGDSLNAGGVIVVDGCSAGGGDHTYENLVDKAYTVFKGSSPRMVVGPVDTTGGVELVFDQSKQISQVKYSRGGICTDPECSNTKIITYDAVAAHKVVPK